MSDGVVLEAAMYIARKHGLRGLTRDRIAALARVSTGTVSHSFGGMDNLVSEVVKAAIESKDYAIIAEALVMKHPVAVKAPLVIRRRAAATLVGK